MRATVVGDTLLWVNRADTPAEIRIVPARGSTGRTYAATAAFDSLETGTVVSISADEVLDAPPRSFGFVNFLP